MSELTSAFQKVGSLAPDMGGEFTLSAADIALGYKGMWIIEACEKAESTLWVDCVA